MYAKQLKTTTEIWLVQCGYKHPEHVRSVKSAVAPYSPDFGQSCESLKNKDSLKL